MRVTSAEFIKGHDMLADKALADKALAEPVTITRKGQDRLVVVSAAACSPAGR